MRQYICSEGKAESLVIFIKDFPGHQAELKKDEKESCVSLSFPGEHMVVFFSTMFRCVCRNSHFHNSTPK